MRPQESACIEHSAELSVVVHSWLFFSRNASAFSKSPLLNCRRVSHGGLGDAILRHGCLFTSVAPGKNDLVLLEILRSDLHPQGNATLFPVVEFPARTVLVAFVNLHADTGSLAARAQSGWRPP